MVLTSNHREMDIATEQDYLLRIRVRHGHGSTLTICNIPITKIDTDNFTIDFRQIMREIFRRECLREFCHAEYERTQNWDLLSGPKNGYSLYQNHIVLIVLNKCPIENILSTENHTCWSGLNCKDSPDMKLVDPSANTTIDCVWANQRANN